MNLIFRNIQQVKEHYFPESTKKEREEEFLRTATPEEIGKRWAEESMGKLRKMLVSITVYEPAEYSYILDITLY